MRTLFSLLLTSSFLLAGPTSQGAPPLGRDAAKLFADACSSCHGANLEGGKGGSLVSGQWRHGGDRTDLLHKSRVGYPEYGMPAFGKTINDAEANALITYLFESATRRVDPQPGEEKTLPVGPQKSEEHSYLIESVAEGLDVPWSIAFLPDGRMLVTERVGRLRLIEHARLLPEPIEGVPEVVVRDDAGLMSVVADPDFAQNHWIYLSFSDPGDTGTAMTKIVRGRLQDHRLTDLETVFSIPKSEYQKGFVLFGGRLVFQNGYLFFSVGERGMDESSTGQAQILSVSVGKIHRVFPDGQIPGDNPFVSVEGAFPSIWSYGVRNPQGLAVDPRDGELWESEHGPRGGDELNHLHPGLNYGWPVITYGINYDGTPITDKTEQAGMEQPAIDWTPSLAVSEIEFYRGDRFPRWKNNLFVGSLAQQKFLRIVIEEGKPIHREEVFHGLGRIRDIKTGPDGFLYLALELIGKPGRIVRLLPADSDSAAEPL